MAQAPVSQAQAAEKPATGEPAKKRAARKARSKAGPTDIADPVMRGEAKRAFVWLGMASLLALGVLLSESLLIIFGGMVFAALVDGGARLLGRVVGIGRGWRVAIVLLLTVAFLVWVVLFAGSQIADQAAQLPATIQAQALRLIAWLKEHGYAANTTNIQGLLEKAKLAVFNRERRKDSGDQFLKYWERPN